MLTGIAKIVEEHLAVAQRARKLVGQHIDQLYEDRGRLRVSEVLALWRLAFEEERRALGLAQTKVEINQTIREESKYPQTPAPELAKKLIQMIKDMEAGIYEPDNPDPE